MRSREDDQVQISQEATHTLAPLIDRLALLSDFD